MDRNSLTRRATLKKLGAGATIAGAVPVVSNVAAATPTIPDLNVSVGDTWTSSTNRSGRLDDPGFERDDHPTQHWYADEQLVVRYNGSNLDNGGNCDNCDVIHNFSVLKYSRTSVHWWDSANDEMTWWDFLNGHGLRLTSPTYDQHLELPVTATSSTGDWRDPNLEVFEGTVLNGTDVSKSTVERQRDLNWTGAAIAAVETAIGELVDKSPVGWVLGAKSVFGALLGEVETETYTDDDMGDTTERTWGGLHPCFAYLHDLELAQPLSQLQGGERYRTPASLGVESFHHDDMNGVPDFDPGGRSNSETYSTDVWIDIDKETNDGCWGC